MARGATDFVRRGFLVRLGPLRLLLPLVALRSALAEAAALGGALPDRPSLACRPGQAALPPLIGRKDRRQLTRALNTTTHVAPWPDLAAPLPICWQPRRTHWVPRRPRQARRRRLRRRCGSAALRVGEATNPGPPQPGTPVGGERPRRMDLDSPRERSPARNAPPRVFGPVPSCPCSQALTARGWTSHASMRHHLDDHASGSLQGTLSAAYLAAHNLDLCSVCGLTVAHRSNGTHPRCRPQQRQHARNSHASERSGARLAGPSLAEIFAVPGPVLRHVPKAARSGWAQCLARSIAAVADQNSLSAWVQLCMLPKAVLRPAPRGGVSRRNQAASFTQRRCVRWLEGERHELWEPERSSRQRRRPHPTNSEDEDDTLLAARHARCLALAAEGELSRACASLVDPPLLEKNAAVIAALRHKHPTAPPARPSLLASGPCPVGAVPDFAVADVVKAARSFRRGSAAGPSGLRVNTCVKLWRAPTAMRLQPTSLGWSSFLFGVKLLSSWRSILLGPPCTPYPRVRMMCGQLQLVKLCGAWLPSASAPMSNPKPVSGFHPYRLVWLFPWVLKRPCIDPGTGSMRTATIPTRFSSSWTSSTLSTPLIGQLFCGRCGCAFPPWPLGQSGATATTPSSSFKVKP